MTAARPLLGFLALLLVAGGIVFQFLVILSGSTLSTPEDQIYFLEASTDGIPGAENPARWTFFAICSVADGRNVDCRPPRAALPFDPARNFDTTNGVAEGFQDTREFFYLSRFMFAFYLIALFFAVVSLFTGLGALCIRVIGYLSGFLTSVALFFQTVAAVLLTVWVVRGRDIFRDNDQPAHVGVKGIAFTWAAMACFFIATVLFCCGGAGSRREATYARPPRRSFFDRFRRRRSVRSVKRDSYSP